MKQIQIIILTFLLTGFFSQKSDAHADKTKLGNASAVVEKFCQADSLGTRLSSETSHQVRALTTWEDEPGWDHVVVIESFRMTKEVYFKETARVTVFYKILGKQKEEKVNFKLVLVKREWKIDSPQLEPHVLSRFAPAMR